MTERGGGTVGLDHRVAHFWPFRRTSVSSNAAFIQYLEEGWLRKKADGNEEQRIVGKES